MDVRRLNVAGDMCASPLIMIDETNERLSWFSRTHYILLLPFCVKTTQQQMLHSNPMSRLLVFRGNRQLQWNYRITFFIKQRLM